MVLRLGPCTVRQMFPCGAYRRPSRGTELLPIRMVVRRARSRSRAEVSLWVNGDAITSGLLPTRTARREDPCSSARILAVVGAQHDIAESNTTMGTARPSSPRLDPDACRAHVHRDAGGMALGAHALCIPIVHRGLCAPARFMCTVRFPWERLSASSVVGLAVKS